MSGLRSLRALRALRSTAATLRLTTALRGSASASTAASSVLRAGLLAQRSRLPSPLSWLSTHTAGASGHGVGGASYPRHPAVEKHAPLTTSTVGQPSSGGAAPFKSVFGVENISVTPAAPAAPSSVAASATASTTNTTLATGASTSQSPSAAYQPGAEVPAAAAAIGGGGSGNGTDANAGAVDAAGAEPKKKGVRELLRQYGIVWGATYAGLYVGTLFSLYGLIQSGVLGGQDAIDLLQSSGLDKTFGLNVEELNPKHGNFAVAWVATKFTEPIRLGLSIFITPRIARIPAIAQFLPKQPTAAEAAATAAAAQPTEAAKASGRHAAGL